MYGALQKAITHVIAFLFSIACAMAFINVIMRYVFNNSLPYAEEVIRYVFIWMFFFGAAEATRQASHVALDIIPDMLKGMPKKTLVVFLNICSSLFLGYLGFIGYKFAMFNMIQKTAALQIPFGMIHMAIPVGCALMLYFNIRNLVVYLRTGKMGDGTTGGDTI